MTASAPDATPVRRGAIWWVNLDPAQGSEIRKTRPAIVVTANALNRARVVVVPPSTGPATMPAHHCLYPFGRALVAVCDQVRAVDKRRLTKSEGQLSAVDLRSIEDSLRRVLEL